ncbi:MAG: hypothetical protein LAT61_09800 [Alcanivorax sp.]|nr:hypothetical protein [Alcanivorax sp.]
MLLRIAVAGGLFLGAGALAHAAPVTIELARHDPLRAYYPAARFEINPALGRAWVAVSFDLMPHPNGGHVHAERVQVEGLFFDPEHMAVILNVADQHVTCATVREQRFLGLTSHRISATGNCRIETVTTREPVDNGFFVNMREVSRTLLHVDGLQSEG